MFVRVTFGLLLGDDSISVFGSSDRELDDELLSGVTTGVSRSDSFSAFRFRVIIGLLVVVDVVGMLGIGVCWTRYCQ